MHRFVSAIIVTLLAWVCPASGKEIKTDVCVYGATSGGVIAAVQAARMGKSVALLSTNTQVGGMTTGGLGSTDVGVSASIGGLALEFYTGIGAHYGVKGPKFTFEPHVAEQEFNALLAGAGVTVRTNQLLTGVVMSGQRIAQIKMTDGTVYHAGMFIDTTYEGDLMAMAGVTWTIGRESSATYGENVNGVTAGVPGDVNALNLDPYVVPKNPASGLLPLLQSGNSGTVGAADTRVQAYNYRLCLTSNAANQIPIPAPVGYNEARYELLRRVIAARLTAGKTPQLTDFLAFFSLPGSKFDINNCGNFSTDYVGGSDSYATAPSTQRKQIADDHLAYLQGYLYYLGHSTHVPSTVRAHMLGYGLCRDEFTDTGGWPSQLYVREARRMVSDYVMLQQNCVGERIAQDSIGLASNSIDCHDTKRFAKNGAVWSEGGLSRGVDGPYPISYRSIIPRVGECENLLVPWSLSASHIAFCSIRMEPVFMILSQSAATAAALAIENNLPVQQVNYAQLAPQLQADNQSLAWTGTTGKDFDGDGKPDYLLFNPASLQTAIWHLNGPAILNTRLGPTLPADWSVVGVGDFNYDGRLDYLLFNARTRQTAFSFMNDTVQVGGAPGPILPPGWSIVGVADFNMDRKPDFLLFNASTLETAIWYLNGNHVVKELYGPSLPPGWAVAGVADFNGDGKPDYLLFQASTGRTAYWTLDNNLFVSAFNGPTLPVGWAVSGMADFNGDGHPDYCIVNPITRQTAIWYLNGGTMVNGANAPAFPSGWELVSP